METDPLLPNRSQIAVQITAGLVPARWTVLKLRSELLDLVPKDEAPDDRDVYLRSLVGNNTCHGRANMLNEEKRWNILLIARVVTRAWPGEEAFKAAAKDSQADPELYTLVNNLRNSYALLRTAMLPSNLWDMLEKVNKSVEDEWIKNTAQYKAFKSKKNPGLGEEELVRETIEFSEYANPLNRTILAAMQEGVSYELLHECLSNVLRGHLKLNKVVNWLKAEKNVVTVKVVIAKHFKEFDDFSTARLQQILGPQFTSQFVIDLAKSTNDLIKKAQGDA
eukprot:g46455.t1